MKRILVLLLAVMVVAAGCGKTLDKSSESGDVEITNANFLDYFDYFVLVDTSIGVDLYRSGWVDISPKYETLGGTFVNCNVEIQVEYIGEQLELDPKGDLSGIKNCQSKRVDFEKTGIGTDGKVKMCFPVKFGSLASLDYYSGDDDLDHLDKDFKISIISAEGKFVPKANDEADK